MTNVPQISVIIPNYNHKDYLEQAISSVENQTYPNVEVVLVDDGSNDGSQVLVSKYKNKTGFKVVNLPTNRGKWYALNVGIDVAEGKLIAIQDADDVCSPDRLEAQYACMVDLKSYHNLCGFVHCYSEEDVQNALSYRVAPSTTLPTIGHEEVTKRVHHFRNQNGFNHYCVDPKFEVHGASCLFYKQHWDHGMRFLPGNMGLRCQKAEDSDFNTKMTLLLQKTSVLQLPLYGYRRNTGNNPAWKEGL